MHTAYWLERVDQISLVREVPQSRLFDGPPREDDPDSDRERDGLLEAGLKAGKKINKEDGIQRYKGLGEMDAKELWETTMDPSVRVLRQVTLDDAAAADELFSILMGEDVDARRSFITRNAKDVRFLDV